MANKKTANNGIGAGKPGPGRPKGSENRLTRSAKQAFEHAFEQLGGPEALTVWAKDNPSDFYRLYARLIPKPVEVSGPDGAAIPQIQVIPKFKTAQEFVEYVRSEQAQRTRKERKSRKNSRE